MKKTWFLVGLGWSIALGLKAQDDALNNSAQLQEVVIRGARVVSRTDGQLIFPSEEMAQSASSGYHLLRMLPLPNVKVDDVNESIVATSSLIGSVQVRINDVVASAADMQSLQPKEVEKVELIDRPGVRYGDGVGIVINIITRKASGGYVVGASGTYVPKASMARGNAYTKINNGNHEVLLNYSGAYSRSDGYSMEAQTRYLMEEGTSYQVARNTYDILHRNTDHHLQARYSRVNAENAFLATLSTSIADSPRNHKETDVTYPDGRNLRETTDNTEKVVSPWIDLYGKTGIGNQQTIVANASVAHTHTDYTYRFASDKDTFGYSTLGKAWSLRSEAIYENRMKPFTLSAGARYHQKYIDNDYSGDATQVSQIHSGSLQSFVQLKGSLGKIGYMAGVDLTREYYRQGEISYDKLWLRPKLNLSLPVSQHVRLDYTFTTAPAPSRLQNMSSMSIMTNEMEYSVGNPNLIMARRDEHTLSLSYQSPRLYNRLMAFFRHNAHPAMQHIYRTDDSRFAVTYLEGRRIDFLLLQNYTSCDIVPKHLNAYLSAEMLHIVNDGQDYSHRLTSFNFQLGLTAWLGNWTLMANMDNGFHFMESEYEARNILSSYLSASYRIKRLAVGLFCQNPFRRNGKVEEVENYNQLVHKFRVVRNRDTSSAIGFKLTWTLSKGRQYKGLERDTDRLKDTETGVAKPGR